jgi:hypothetical protein
VHCYCWLTHLLLIVVGCILSGVNSDVVSCKSVLQYEGDIPTIDIDVAQEDKGDGVTEVTITCECHMCCDLHLACFLVPDDEPLAASAGFEYKKLTIGFPTPFKFQSRSKWPASNAVVLGCMLVLACRWQHNYDQRQRRRRRDGSYNH